MRRNRFPSSARRRRPIRRPWRRQRARAGSDSAVRLGAKPEANSRTEYRRMFTIRVGRRPKRSAARPNRKAPMGRIASVSRMAKVTSEMSVWNSAAMSFSTNTSRKKSNASSVHPRKLAATTCRCALVQPESAGMPRKAGGEAGGDIAQIRRNGGTARTRREGVTVCRGRARHIGRFESKIRNTLATLRSASEKMRVTSDGMSSVSAETNAQVRQASTASGTASSHVQSVAAASEQLSASIADISRQVSHAAGIAGRAVEQTRQTDGTVQGLAATASRIGEVVELINSIAGQTNLLGIERDHRGGARRRSRQGFCRGRLRGQIAGDPDRQGHRGNLAADFGRAERRKRGGRSHQGYRRHHRRGQPGRRPRSRPRSRSRAPPPRKSPAAPSRRRMVPNRPPTIFPASPRAPTPAVRPPPTSNRPPRCWRFRPAN